MIIKKIIKYLLIIFFPSFLISFTNISRNFKEDILRLVFVLLFLLVLLLLMVLLLVLLVLLVLFLVLLLEMERVEILFEFFVRNNLLSKLLRIFSLALNNNRTFFGTFSKLLQFISKMTLLIISFFY